jgi:hypothetical protein
MGPHRFREALQTGTQPSPLPNLGFSAFVPFPVNLNPHQAQILAIYRVAAERVRAQLQNRRPAFRLPEFSAN